VHPVRVGQLRQVQQCFAFKVFVGPFSRFAMRLIIFGLHFAMAAR